MFYSLYANLLTPNILWVQRW